MKTNDIGKVLTTESIFLLLCYSFYKAVVFNGYVTDFNLYNSALGYVSNLPFMAGASAGILISASVIFIVSSTREMKPYSLDYRIPLVVLALAYVPALFFQDITLLVDPLISVLVPAALGLTWGLFTTMTSIMFVELFVYESSPTVFILQLACASFFSATLSVFIDYLPQTAASLICIGLLVVCLPMVRRCRRDLVPYEVSQDRGSFRQALKETSTPLLAYLLFEMITGLVNMFSYMGSSTFIISTSAPIQGMFISAVLVAVFVILTNRAPNQRVVYLFVFPGIIAIFLLLPFFGEAFGKPMSMIIYSAYIFTSMLSTFCYIVACREARGNIYRVASLIGGLARIALIIGLTLGGVFANFSAGETFVQLSIVGVFCIYCLVMVLVFWGFKNSRKQVQVVVQQVAVSKSFEEAEQDHIDDIVSQFNLTGRERDVLIGLAKGNSAASIASQLYISTSTAQGYIKSLYVKLGVNKKQQIIDMFNRGDDAL